MIEFCLIRARINREQQVTLLDFLAFLEMNLVEITADARPHFDGLRRFEPPDVFVPLDYFARHGLNDGNGGRRWSRWLRAFSATREKRADQKSGECEPAVRSHGFHSFWVLCRVGFISSGVILEAGLNYSTIHPEGGPVGRGGQWAAHVSHQIG